MSTLNLITITTTISIIFFERNYINYLLVFSLSKILSSGEKSIRLMCVFIFFICFAINQ